MRRFLTLLRVELVMARMSLPVHLVAAIQPTVFFFLLALILVNPSMTMIGASSEDERAQAFYWELDNLHSPEGVTYVDLELVDTDSGSGLEQFISFEDLGDQLQITQAFGLIDSNRVKNYRNRLTAAALQVWNEKLQIKAVNIVERPWLENERAFSVYFGLALLPFAVILSSAIVGAVSGAQEFEKETITEVRLAPVFGWLPLAARIGRLGILSSISVGLLLVALGLTTGVWPSSLLRLFFILLLLALIGAALGITLGMVFKKTMPAYVGALSLAISGWIFGGGLGLPSGFGGIYETISYLTPNANAIYLIFPEFYGKTVGNQVLAVVALLVILVLMLVLMVGTQKRLVIDAQ